MDSQHIHQTVLACARKGAHKPAHFFSVDEIIKNGSSPSFRSIFLAHRVDENGVVDPTETLFIKIFNNPHDEHENEMNVCNEIIVYEGMEHSPLVAHFYGCAYFTCADADILPVPGYGIILEARPGRSLEEIWATEIEKDSVLKESIKRRYVEFCAGLRKIKDADLDGVWLADPAKRNVLWERERDLLTIYDFEGIWSVDERQEEGTCWNVEAEWRVLLDT